jgi:hypothetical protein
MCIRCCNDQIVNQSAYNEGPTESAQPFGSRDAKTESGSVNALDLPGESEKKFEGPAAY